MLINQSVSGSALRASGLAYWELLKPRVTILLTFLGAASAVIASGADPAQSGKVALNHARRVLGQRRLQRPDQLSGSLAGRANVQDTGAKYSERPHCAGGTRTVLVSRIGDCGSGAGDPCASTRGSSRGDRHIGGGVVP